MKPPRTRYLYFWTAFEHEEAEDGEVEVEIKFDCECDDFEIISVKDSSLTTHTAQQIVEELLDSNLKFKTRFYNSLDQALCDYEQGYDDYLAAKAEEQYK